MLAQYKHQNGIPLISFHFPSFNFLLKWRWYVIIDILISAHLLWTDLAAQWWNITKYMYSNTVVKKKQGICASLFPFPATLYFHSTTFWGKHCFSYHIYLVTWLLLKHYSYWWHSLLPKYYFSTIFSLNVEYCLLFLWDEVRSLVETDWSDADLCTFTQQPFNSRQ